MGLFCIRPCKDIRLKGEWAVQKGLQGLMVYTYFMRDQYDFYARQGRKENKPKKFTDCVKECLKKIEDIILVESGKDLVDLDILIDILTDSKQEEEESLQLYAVRAIIKSGKKEIDMNELVLQMKSEIQRLSLKDNVKKWTASFKKVEKGNSNCFQAKKLKEYMQNMEGEGKLTRDQEIAFKNRDAWTYNELMKACTNPK